MSATICLICQGPVQQPARGRHRRYCSPPCRKSAELELRRLEARLSHLDTWASNCRMWGGDLVEKQLPRAEAEISRLRARQLLLLGRPADSPLVRPE